MLIHIKTKKIFLKYFISFLFLFLFKIEGNSQTIQGKIKSLDKTPVVFANVLVKDIDNRNSISEYTISKKGVYNLKIKKKYKGILVEVKVIGYLTEKYIIKNLQNKTYNIDFVLKKDTVKIKEVVVVGDRTPFMVKEDTVTYNIKAYLDGSERKVEDIIKKLPGIDVNKNTGEIKYKNKSVETVLLDGDNLFGYNYTLGTKNININMLEQVQAIENYSANPLLKGLESGNKVVLNLKLKKKKMDFSGNVGFGSGLFNDITPTFLSDNNILGITKNYKSFATLSYNNIGENYTPFDYFSLNMNMEQNKEKIFFSKKIIPETSFSDELGNRTNINNQYFGNYNFIFKIGKRISIKSNLYYLNDKISTKEMFNNQYFIEEDTFSTVDNKEVYKKPIQYRGDFNIKINTSKTSLLEYDMRIKQEDIETPSSVISNNENNFESLLKTNDYFFKNKLLFTQKISAKKAMQFSVLQTTNDIEQTLYISPSVIETDNYNQNIQSVDVKKNYIEAKGTFLGKNRNKYSISVGGIFNKNNIQTELFGNDQTGTIMLVDNRNKLEYAATNFYQTASYHIDVKGWRFSPAYLISYLSQERNDIITDTINSKYDFIIKPSLNIKYQINENSFLLWSVGYDKYANTEQYLFQIPVLIDNRTTISNLSSLELNETLNYGFTYYYNNLYNQLNINLGVNYQENTGNYFANVNINENISHVNYFYLPQDNNNLTFNFRTSKYISFLSSKLVLSSYYSVTQYNNIVNNSELRHNTSDNLNAQLSINTAFRGFLNFSNEFSYNSSQSKSENSDIFIINSINNSFNIRLKLSKRCFALFSANYFLPNIDESENDYLFIDATINLLSKSKKWEFTLIANNLLNKDNFEQIQATDYSVNLYRTNIFQRYFLFNISYSF